MNRNQPPRPYDAQDEQELYDELFSVASMTECTGLVPASPLSRPEVESYSEIYDIPLAKDEMTDLATGHQKSGDEQQPL